VTLANWAAHKKVINSFTAITGRREFYKTRGRQVIFVLLAAAAAAVCFYSSARADVIEVSGVDFDETRKMDLREGQFADVIVYLKSFGDMVDKYLVTLRSGDDNKRVSALLSDQHGRVLFKKLPPGKYRIEVSRRIREDGRLSTVSIGDVMLSPAGENRFGLGNR
jgi:hypothetical protein